MTMRHTISRLLLHLGQHIAHDLGVVIRPLGRTAHVHSDIAQLRPRQRMVQVVFEKVVFGEILQIGVLDEREVRAAEDADVHCGGLSCRGTDRVFRWTVVGYEGRR